MSLVPIQTRDFATGPQTPPASLLLLLLLSENAWLCFRIHLVLRDYRACVRQNKPKHFFPLLLAACVGCLFAASFTFTLVSPMSCHVCCT